jgi:hypothetical protein
MNIGIILALLFWAAGPLPAEDDVFRHPLGQEGMDSFREICARLSEHPVIKGDFEQEKTSPSLDRPLVSRGTFIIVPGTGMVWKTLEPFPSTVVAGRDYLVRSRPGGRKTRLDTRGGEIFRPLAALIASVFSGDAQGLLEGFEVFFSGEGAAWEMGLIPLEGSLRAFAAAISMAGDRAIRLIRIQRQNGDTIRYAFSNHRYPPALTSDEAALFLLP